VWQPGGYFVQSHIYWGFLICVLTGMRPGEVGQLKCADIRTDGAFFYFDMRPFDARNGRVAVKDLRNLKTNAAGRVVPIHPLLIELGLLDRMQDLLDQKEEQLFPEWKAYTRKKDGTIRWSLPLSKAWQYVKKKLALTRADLTLPDTSWRIGSTTKLSRNAHATASLATPVMCAAVTDATAYLTPKLQRRSSSLNRRSSST
jgi:integrase